MMRLNQYLAACGLGSRRACEALVAAGRVRVNGETAHFGMRIGAADTVLVDDRRVEPEPRGDVWLLHKPAGSVSTARDERGRPTVFDLARRAGLQARLFSVGRLDLETTGLLLLTNDGDLAFRLTHPSHGVEKEYEARIERGLDSAALAALAAGLDLEDGRTAPCQASQERRGADVVVRLVLHEGRKRQVRRMLAAVGAPVLALHRVRVGPVLLGDLRPGELRPATETERAALWAAAGEPAKA
jgi:23S rRNA pseudouridine2605 synthase